MSATFTPSRAARVAIASPIPRLPPDMKMTRSFRESAIAAAYGETVAARRVTPALALKARQHVLGELVQETGLVLAGRVDDELVEAKLGVAADAGGGLLGVVR